MQRKPRRTDGGSGTTPQPSLQKVASATTMHPPDGVPLVLGAQPHAALLLDEGGRVIAANDQTAQLLGRPSATLTGMALTDLLPGRLHEPARTFLRRFADADPVVPSGAGPELAVVHPVHGEVAVQLGARSLTLESTRLVSVTLLDITDRVHAREALRRNEEKFRLLVENSTDLVAEVNPATAMFRYTNHAFTTCLGYEPGELTDTNVFAHVHPDDVAPAQAKFALPEATARFRYRHKNGAWHWLEVSGRDFVTPSQQIRGVLIGRDITASQQMEAALRENEEHLSLVFNSARDMMLLARVEPDGDFRVASVNRQYLQTVQAAGLAVTEADLLGKTFVEVLALFGLGDEAGATILARYAEVVRTGQPLHYEEITDTPKGRFYGDTTLTPVCNEAGVCRFVLYSSADITQRRRAEDAARAADARLAEIVAHSTEAIFSVCVHENGEFTYESFNPAAERVSGIRHEAARGRKPQEIFAPAVAAQMLAHYRRCLTAGEPIDYVTAIDFPPGKRTFHTFLLPIRDTAGRIVRLAGFARDITAQAQAEQALRESEEKFSKAFVASPDVISISDLASGRYLDVNGAFTRAFGYRRDEVIGRTSQELGINRNPAQRDAILARLTRGENVRDIETRVHDRHGEPRTFLVSAELLELGGRRCVLRVSHDVTEHQRAEQALRESEEKFSKAFLASPDAITLIHLPTGRIVSVNDGFTRLFGHAREEVIGRTAIELNVWHDLRDRERYYEAIRTDGMARDIEAIGRRKDGALVVVLLSAEKVEVGGEPHIVSVAHDITARRATEREKAKLEAQLRQTQKLEALGTLAGGIAHDFNNILTAIMAYGELAELDAERPKELRSHLAEVRRASERAKDLVKQILTFSRQQQHERKPVQVALVVREALRLLRSTLPATIQIEASIQADAPLALVDPTQVHQVVMNLCTNAAHAMQGRTGRLTVRLDALTPDPELVRAHPELLPVLYVRIVVRDTGHGMSEDTLKRIFDPFFTTKGPGEGTGLGLAVVHGIVRDHDGAIMVQSQPGAGSEFQVYLPAVMATETPADTAADPTLPRGQNERVLVIDDEPPIRDALRLVLERLGFRVEAFSDPRQALARFNSEPDAFDLVVTDLTMPELTGVDLARVMLERRPDLPVIVVSGFSATWTPESIRAIGVVDLVAKPLSLPAIATAVRSALDRRKPQPPPR